ncbi:hypothetical protein NC652_041373 [Populus alba x Populus x berolinensis]|nr:hypothetical protein NC652_041373 [Populus alba x Populus x berolinensis]
MKAMACCSSFHLLFLWFFLFFCFLSVQPLPMFVFLCFFFSLPYMLCSSLWILYFLPSLPFLCLAVFFFFFLFSPGFYLCFHPPGSFGFPLVLWFVPFSSSFLCFFSWSLSIYSLSIPCSRRRRW